VALLIGFFGLFLGGLRDIGGWFSPYRWWFVAAIAVGLLGVAARARWVPYHQEHYCLYALMAVSALSCVVSPMPEYSFARLATFVVMFFAVFIAGWAWLQNARNAALVVSLLVLSAVIGALASLYYLLEQGQLVPSQRITGAFGKATGTGSFAAAGLPLVLWKWQYARGKQRLFYSVVLAILGYLLVFSGARAAAVGGIAAAIVWFWKHHRGLRPVLANLGLLVFALFFVGVLSMDMLPDYIVRKETISTFTGRMPRWRVGLALFLQSPAIGHGYGMTRYIRLYQEGEHLRGQLVPAAFSLSDLLPGSRQRLGRMTLHSDQVERLVETGVAGFVPFALFWYFVMRRVAKALLGPVTVVRSLAIALGLNVSYLFLDSFMHGALFAINAPGTTLSWLVIALFMATSDLAIGESRPRSAYSAHYPQR
jgi:O-antigen ligase